MNTKTIGLIALIVVVMGGLVLNAKFGQPVEVTNVKIEKETVEVHPDWSTDEEAVAAAQAVIDRKRAEAELNDVQAQIEALRARETELEKELLVY